MPEEQQPVDLNTAQHEYFSRDGGVGQEASGEEAHDWLMKALETLPYPSPAELEMADKEGTECLWDKSGTPLENAQKFVTSERERLEKLLREGANLQ